MQFTVVLTATKSRKSRLTSTRSSIKKSESCCTIDVWGIALNITLQDAPFLVFRLLLITHFKIISYMNVFFTCKNTLVILLQLYRLYVVHSEHTKKQGDVELTNISIISKGDLYGERKSGKKRDLESSRRHRNRKVADFDDGMDGEDSGESVRSKKKVKSVRKDTGYSTGSSRTSIRHPKKLRSKSREEDGCISDSRTRNKQKLRRSDKETKGRKRLEEPLSEESESEEYKPTKERSKPLKERPKSSEKKRYEREVTLSINTSDPSSE